MTLQLSSNVLFIIHAMVCSCSVCAEKCRTSFKINFLLNFGLLNSVKLSSENMSKSGEINEYMCYPYPYAYAHYTWIHSFLSTHKRT